MNTGQIIHSGDTHLRVIYSGPEVTRLKDIGTGAIAFVHPDGSVTVTGDLSDITPDFFNAVKIAHKHAYNDNSTDSSADTAGA